MAKIKTSDIFLDMLMSQNGKALSGEEAAARLGISRVSVWKAAQKLRAEGYGIEGGQNKGYILNPESDILNASVIEKNLSAFAKSVCGGKIEVFKTIDSTNTEAKRRLASFSDSKALHGTVLFAEHQSQGRGRFSRSFYSPKEAGLYFSLIFCPSVPQQQKKDSENSPPDSSFYTAISAAVICRCLKQAGFEPQIKWVNDIYLNGKKICGILSEAVIDMETSSVQAVIIGIGINVKGSAFPEELKNKAGYLFEKAGYLFEKSAPFSRNSLAASILSCLIEALYGFYPQAELMEEYKSLSMLTGKRVRVLPFSGESYEAEVLGINGLGHLIIKSVDGVQKELLSGEVSLELE